MAYAIDPSINSSNTCMRDDRQGQPRYPLVAATAGRRPLIGLAFSNGSAFVSAIDLCSALIHTGEVSISGAR